MARTLITVAPNAKRGEIIEIRTLIADPFDGVTGPGVRRSVHFCLGASLARAEIKATMRQLVERLPDLELAGPVRRLHSDFVNGIKTMPVRFTPTEPSRKD